MQWAIFDAVDEQLVTRVLQTARARRFDRGQVVFYADDPADTLHLIVSGRFSVSISTPLGDTAVLHVLGPGEHFGEIALVEAEARRSATVTAVEAGRTLAVHRLDFDRLRVESPNVDAVVIAVLSAQVRRLSGRLVEALYVPVEQRVRRRLLDLAAMYGDEDPTTVTLTQAQLAELTGTSRQMVNGVLRSDEEAGVLQLGRGRVTVLDRAALTRRARL